MLPERAGPRSLAAFPALPARSYGVSSTPERIVLRVRPLEDRNIAHAVRLALRLAVPLVPVLTLGLPREGAYVPGFTVWILLWVCGLGFITRVAPFQGPVLRVVRRSLVIDVPPEAGYRDEGDRARLTIDGRPIDLHTARVALARLHEPGQRSNDFEPWTVNLVLSESLVRVAKLRREATARKLAESLAAALGIAHDSGAVVQVSALPGYPLDWKVGIGAFGYGMAVAGLAIFGGVQHNAGDWLAGGAIVLVLDVCVFDVLVARYLRSKAEGEARESFRFGST
jgi:hypothetical protein